MRKLLLSVAAIIVFAVLVIFVLPAALGFWVKHKYEGMLAHFSSPGMQLELESYNRGWFTSTAVVKVLVNHQRSLSGQLGHMLSPQLQHGLHNLIIKTTIHQGPIIITHKADGSPYVVLGQALISTKAADGGIDAHSLIRIDGGILTVLEVAHFAQQSSGGRLALDNVETRFEIGNTGTSISGTADIGKLVSQHANSKKSAEGVKLSVDLIQLKPHLWLGSRTLSIKNFSITGLTKQLVTIKNIRINGLNTLTRGRVNTQVSIAAQQLAIGSKQYGPYQLSMAAYLLPAHLLSQLNGQIMLFQASGKPTRTQEQDIYQTLGEIFDSGFKLQVSQLKIATRWGYVESRGRINIVRSTQTNKDRFSRVTANIWLQLPETMVKHLLNMHYERRIRHVGEDKAKQTSQAMVKQHIDLAIKNGWLKAVGNSYRVNIQIMKNRLYLNGKPAPKGPLLQVSLNG